MSRENLEMVMYLKMNWNLVILSDVSKAIEQAKTINNAAIDEVLFDRVAGDCSCAGTGDVEWREIELAEGGVGDRVEECRDDVPGGGVDHRASADVVTLDGIRRRSGAEIEDVQPAPKPNPKVGQEPDDKNPLTAVELLVVYEYVQDMVTHVQDVGMSEYDLHRYAYKQKLLYVVESVVEAGASRLNINTS
ncbi:hypothetical protein DVH05_026382 [Phytophthora capsici]|nr:hypothetical protein DVH05_026382 [Phytophthora capsici]